jgi:hypothetical protein
MLLSPLTRTIAMLARHRTRRAFGIDAVAGAGRVALITLAVAAAFALVLHRPR